MLFREGMVASLGRRRPNDGILMKWVVQDIDLEQSQHLAAQLDISPVLAQILVGRGFVDPARALEFLQPSLANCHDYRGLPDISQAVARVSQAIDRQEPIVVYGDYDVDGLTATALLIEVLRKLGGDVDFYIPHRLTEGYGLHEEAIRELSSRGTKVIITVDCGASAIIEAEVAKAEGIDLVITDHHEMGESTPRAVAVVNPKRVDSTYPFQDLAGVGVAYKLAQALWEKRREDQFPSVDYLDLVALGTVADVVPLLDENRVFTRFGLPRIGATQRIGLRALLEVADLQEQEIEAYHVGFMLAPRLNAAGRMDHAQVALDLLLSQDPKEALELAQTLDATNRQRQQDESRIVQEAEEMVHAQNLLRNRALVLASPNWSSGIVGIAASRLVDRYHRPTILIGLDDELGKGSGRSIEGFDLYEALGECSDALEGYGGHKMAAGVAVLEERIDQFAQSFISYANARLSPGDIVPKLKVDALVDIGGLSLDLVDQLGTLEPFGPGNPKPVFGCRAVRVVDSRRVGANKDHLKLCVGQQEAQLPVIGFRMGDRQDVLGEQVDLAFRIGKNQWQGEIMLQGQLVDIGCSIQPAAYVHRSRVYDGRKVLSKPMYVAELLQREEQVSVYIGVAPCTKDEVEDWKQAGFTPKATRSLGDDGGVVSLEHMHGTAQLFYGCSLEEETLAGIGCSCLAVWGMPPGYDRLGRLLAGFSDAPEVHLLVDRDQAAKTKTLLRVICPNRRMLGSAYLRLQKEPLSRQDFTAFVTGDMKRLIKPFEELSECLGNLVATVVLDIFGELGLLVDTDDGRLSVSHPGCKLDLETSIRYNDNKFLVGTFSRFYRYLTTQPVTKIIEDLNTTEIGASRRVLGGTKVNGQGNYRLSQGGH
ncbi:MAG: single-stranded-DNA-specific exonuclease RecJ [Limnochordia bacterium]|jgi:single-stranded-DNA-specific exonuclease RecJ